MRLGRIFGLGLSRTGTTSLHAAMTMLGYSSIHYPLCYENLAAKWLLGDFSQDSTMLFQCYFDLPTPVYFREFDRTHPGAKFILTRRDAPTWIESVREIYSRKPPVSPKTPWRNHVTVACYGTIRFERQRFLDVYKRHNDAVISYFQNRPQDLLVIDLSDGSDHWRSICGFLNIEVPDVRFPHIRDPHIGSLSWVRVEEVAKKSKLLARLGAST